MAEQEPKQAVKPNGVDHEIRIKYLSGGQINIEGPIHDTALMMSLMGHAFHAWAKFIQEKDSQTASRIIKPPPNMVLPGRG